MHKPTLFGTPARTGKVFRADKDSGFDTRKSVLERYDNYDTLVLLGWFDVDYDHHPDIGDCTIFLKFTCMTVSLAVMSDLL